jgi:hypothetical protein
VVALTQGRGRRWWHDQILGEGRRSEGGGSQKAGGGCSRCAPEGGWRRGKNGTRQREAAPFLNSAAGSRGRGGGGLWHEVMCGRREWGAWSRPTGDSVGGAATVSNDSVGGAAWSARGSSRGR